MISFKICGNRPDHQTYQYIQSQDRKLCEYLKEKRIPPDFMSDIDSISVENPDPTYEEEIKKKTRVADYIHWLVFEQNERVVIGGGYAGITFAENYMYHELPIVVKGTSLTKSMIRRLQRMSRKTDNIIDFVLGIIKRIPVFYSQYSRMYPQVDNTRRVAMNQEFNWVRESAVSYQDRFISRIIHG